MVKSKSATPASISENHPAQDLVYVDEDIKSQLLKTPFQLLIESDTYQIQLKELRNSWKYAVVLQWLYFFRGAIKLAGEPFTVDIIEEEIVGLTESNLLVKVYTNLASALLGSKVLPDQFSFKTRYLLGDTTDLLGTEDDPTEFEDLSLLDRFDIIYQLIFQFQYTDAFRKQVEKYEKESDLRFDSIYTDGLISYYLLSDNRIYKRTLVNFPEMKVPKKYKYAKKIDPETDFADIEPEFEWELVAIGIYQIHDFLLSIQKVKKLRSLSSQIKSQIDIIANEDLTKRKRILKRKREQQLNELVNHRKRSSRLQEKEEQMRLEKEKQVAEENIRKQEQAKIKLVKRIKSKVNEIKGEIEERLRRSTSTRRNVISDLEAEPAERPDDLGENDWWFECYCGIKGKNYDDGVKMISCERCHRWQHLKCQDRTVHQALVRNSNEIFICNWCKKDLEVEVIQKLEDERIQKEKEIEEKQKRRELQKQREEEERLRLEELERQRKEDLEKERERREKARESSVSLSQRQTSQFANTPPPTAFHPSPQSNLNGPVFGTFQAYIPPASENHQPQQALPYQAYTGSFHSGSNLPSVNTNGHIVGTGNSTQSSESSTPQATPQVVQQALEQNSQPSSSLQNVPPHAPEQQPTQLQNSLQQSQTQQFVAAQPPITLPPIVYSQENGKKEGEQAPAQHAQSAPFSIQNIIG